MYNDEAQFSSGSRLSAMNSVHLAIQNFYNSLLCKPNGKTISGVPVVECLSKTKK